MSDTVSYLLITALFVLPMALLFFFLVRVLLTVFANQSLLLSSPFG